MRIFSVMLLLAAAAALSGCNIMGFSHPVGTPSPEIAEQVQGAWANPEGVVFVRHEDGPTFTAGFLQESDEAGFEIEQIPGQIGELNEDVVVNLRFDHENQTYWAIARIVVDKQGDTIVMYPARPDIVRRMVEDGTLKGTIDEGQHGFDVLVTDEAAKVNALLDRHRDELWVYDEPTVYRRVTGWPGEREAR